MGLLLKHCWLFQDQTRAPGLVPLINFLCVHRLNKQEPEVLITYLFLPLDPRNGRPKALFSQNLCPRLRKASVFYPFTKLYLPWSPTVLPC